LSVVRLDTGAVTAEVPCGRRPSALALTPDGHRLLMTTSYGGELVVFDLVGDSLTRAGTVRLGFEPHGVAVAPDGRRAYVALASAGAVAVVDLVELKE